MGKAPRIAVPLGIAAVTLLAAHGFAQTQNLIPPGALDTGTPRNATNSENPAMVQDWRSASGQIMVASSADQAIDATIAEWRRLQQSDTLGFSAYANFITVNQGWPGEDRMRRLAESQVNPASYDAGQTAAFFARFPPLTATGQARHALALSALGRMDEARIAARRAWTQGSLSTDDEQRLMALFAGSFTADDHLRRADILLWSNDNAGAERILGWLLPTRRPVIEARIAMQRRSPDASMRIAAADPIGVTDAGYIADKARWRQAMSDGLGARATLADRLPLSAPATMPEKWYEILLGAARGAGNDGNWTAAYAIASKVDDAFPAGVDISATGRGVRDDYTSLTWLAGTAALNRLGRPGDAAEMFRRYAGGARSAQTISKGYYWAGRSATAAGRSSDAREYFRKASAYPDQYYGQLSLERMGLPVPLPALPASPPVLTETERSAFANRSVVRAARRLGLTGNWRDQSRLLLAIADRATTEKDQLLVAELSRSLARPDLGVMAGRKALQEGLAGQTETRFPRVMVPEEHAANWTMIHAISRQESQFDRAIVSPAGARGLMQLMPGTAREQAGKIGLSYSAASLDEPGYNIRLGSSYFQRLLSSYGGSYPLAVAAYNAGAGNVNKWLAANGDPRLPGGDMVQWVENIPFTETRNYVQRVLENAVVYDLLNPRNSGIRSATPLSRYLGKQQPG